MAERAFNRLKELEARGLRSRTELLVAEADVAKARARADAAERRIRVLGTVADTELARARQRADAAKAKLQAFGGEVGTGGAERVTRIVIRSPIAGVVSARDLTLGQAVEAPRRFFCGGPQRGVVTAPGTIGSRGRRHCQRRRFGAGTRDAVSQSA